MTILSYAVAVIIVLGLCALGLSVGLLLRGRGLQTCGRAQTKTGDGEEITCPACSGKASDCKRS
jgi:hypothetical protein